MNLSNKFLYRHSSILIYYTKLILGLVLAVVLLHLAAVSSSFSLEYPPVVINEVGWMGTSSSNSSDEWIEIYNPTGQDLSLDGWILQAQDGTPKILLTGTILVGGYFLLERTGDTTISDVSADQIYTGALEDTGENLELRDSSGALVDSILAEGASWFSAGFNGSGPRRSMERRSAGVIGSDPSNWQTSTDSPGTPRAQNSDGSGALSPPPQQNQPTLIFAAPANAVAGKDFSVNVTFSNFEAGIYALKVLIGKDGNFIYGKTKGNTGWLSQNGAWKDMPQVQVSSSSSSVAVQAKLDDDVLAGNYQIAVSVAKKDNGESYSTLWTIGELEKKSVSVSAAPVTSTADLESNTFSEEGLIEKLGSAEEPGGKTLGAETVQEKGFRLNFYLILGIFGLLVGSGGLVLAFRNELYLNIPEKVARIAKRR